MGIYTATWVVFANQDLFATGAMNTLVYTITGSTYLDLTSYIPVEVKVIGGVIQPYGATASGTMAVIAATSSTALKVEAGLGLATSSACVILYGIRQ